MRKGLKLKVSNVINTNFFNFFQSSLLSQNNLGWLNIHLTLNVLLQNTPTHYSNYSLKDGLALNLTYNNRFSKDGISFQPKSSFNFLFIEAIKEYLPIFSFFVRRVDKSVRKNSRGKSGKYIIIWKYVPTYKRLYTTLRWFIKDLKFHKLKTFKMRFFKILETFILNPKSSFLVKLRQFVHVYVFENLKNKLMKTLKTTS